jgi:hypothetical protein
MATIDNLVPFLQKFIAVKILMELFSHQRNLVLGVIFQILLAQKNMFQIFNIFGELFVFLKFIT